jgi:ATP-dependent Clp protease ATP-binding subunit ClpA
MIITFKPLDEKAIYKIALKALKELEKREGFLKRGIKLEFKGNLIDYIVEEGFDRNYGARPLKRAIERIVVSELAKYLLKNRDLKDRTLVVDFDGKEVVIKRK